MLSSDKNVETVAQLLEVLRHYLGLQSEYVKLDLVDKVVRLLTAAALLIVFCLLVTAIAFFASFACALWLSRSVGMPLAFLIVAGAYLVLLILLYRYRKPLIERPLVRFLADLLLS